MLKVKTKELEISKELIRKIDMICKLAHVKPKYQNGNIICIDRTNIANDTIKKHILSIAIRNDRITPKLIFDEIDLIDTIYKLEDLE